MVHVLGKVLLLVLLFFMAACPGLKFLRLVGIERRSSLEIFVLSAACGFAIITEGLLVLGMLGFLSPLAIGFLLVILFVSSVREAKYFLDALRAFSPSLPRSFSAHHLVVAAFALFIFINILKALLPPHGPTDVLYYHMTLPKLYLAEKAIVTYPTFFPSFFPSNGELIFAMSLVLGGPIFVNLTHFGFALLTVLALYAYAQKYVQKEFAILPGIIYLTSPVANSWGTMAYTDNILGFYLFLLCMLLMDYSPEVRRKETFAWGLLIGMALGIKYQAMLLIGLIVAFFLVSKIKEWKTLSPLLTISLLIGVLLASPWYIRNLVVTSNPVFPILSDLFPSEMLLAGGTFSTDTKAGEIFLAAFEALKESPLSAPFAFLYSGAWRHDDFQRFVGPLFLGLAPFAFFLKRTPVKWPCILLICLLSLFQVFFLKGNIRYVIVLIILLSFVCGSVGQEVYAFANRRGRLLVTLFFATVILLYALQNYHTMLRDKRVLTSLNPRLTHSFLLAFERSYRVATFVNNNVPADSKVLFHGIARYFYFNFEPLNDHVEQRAIVYDEAKNAEDVLRIMRSHGITHMVRQDRIPERARSNTVLYDEDHRFIAFTRNNLGKIFSANGISVYKLQD